MNRLDQRVAIVTGAGVGIGAASAKRLAAEGARVVVADINLDNAGRVADEIVSSGGQASARKFDLHDEASIQHLIQAAIDRYGKLDIVHNNAANTTPEQIQPDMAIDRMDQAVWDRAFEYNTRGTMLMTKHAIPHMLANGRGSIINTSSGASLTGDLFAPAYAASKAAINNLTLYTAAQYGKRGIRANVVSPGLILTPTATSNNSAEQLARIERHALTPYLGQPEDLAAAVAFLASDDARFVNGHILVVDGGYTSHMAHFADAYDAFIAAPGSRSV